MIKNATNGVGGSMALGAITDGIYGGPNNAGLESTQSWGVRGAFNHNWNPFWSTSLFGGMVTLDYNNNAKNLWCGTYILATNNRGGGITTCDPGFTLSEIG